MLFRLETGLIIWTAISFFTLLFLLVKFGYKPLVTVLEKREETIHQTLETAKKTQREAEKLFVESKKEIAEAKEEVRQLIYQGKTHSESLEKEIIERANEEARNMIMRAQIEIKMEREKAFQELRSQLADLTFDIASKVTRKSLDKKDHIRLMEDLIKEVDSLYEQSYFG